LDDILSYPNDTRHNARERNKERERESAHRIIPPPPSPNDERKDSLSLSVSLSFSNVTKKKEREQRKSGEKKCEKVRRREDEDFSDCSLEICIKNDRPFFSRVKLSSRE
jgi:hypothetical protein